MGVGTHIPGKPGSSQSHCNFLSFSFFSLEAPDKSTVFAPLLFLCLFLSSPHLLEPLQKPEGEREGRKRKGDWSLGVGKSPGAMCVSWGHQPGSVPAPAACTAQAGFCPGCDRALPLLPEEIRPRVGGEGEAHLS